MRLPWPLPALLTWVLAWVLALALQRTLQAGGWALALGAAAGALCALGGTTPARRLWMAAGFPLSVAAVWAFAGGSGAFGAWVWLLMAACVLAVYPLGAWKDAPLFPTPARALDALPLWAPLPTLRADGSPPQVLDAGCGLGDGLVALHRVYPHAQLQGIEHSRLLAALARVRLSRKRVRASVRVGDLWAQPWLGFDAVYLFQRPETMPRAAAKGGAELAPGAWLISLEFPITPEDAAAAGLQPVKVPPPDGPDATGSTEARDPQTLREPWVYRKVGHTEGDAGATQPTTGR
jgi:SAM-dependent methyltransferase